MTKLNGSDGNDMSSEQISVIIITYNRNEKLRRAIDSVVKSHHDCIELIIVNNGSTDGTKDYLDNLQTSLKTFKVVHTERRSISAARNTGLLYVTSRTLTFLDDDDELVPETIPFLYDLLTRYKADISICGTRVVESGRMLDKYVFDEILEMNGEESVVEMLRREKYNVGMPTKLYKRTLFQDIRFFEGDQYDDIRVGYRLFAHAQKVVAQGKPLYLIHRHESNNSTFTTNDKLINPVQLDIYLSAFRERTDYLSKMFPGSAGYFRYTEWSYMISMVNKITINQLVNCKQQLKAMRNVLEENYSEFVESEHIKPFEIEFMNKYFS